MTNAENNNVATAARLIIIDGVTYGGDRPHTPESLKMWEAAIADLKNNEVTTDNYFGGCPQCGQGPYLNIRKSHYGVCETHKVYWPIGSGLFSSWYEEDQEVWDKNAKMLEGFTQIKPIYPADHLANLGPEKNNNSGAAKAERPSIIIKRTRDSVKTPCAICGQETRASEASLDLYLEGTEDDVCVECGRKYAPEMLEAVTAYWKIQNANAAQRPSKITEDGAERERLREELEHYFGKLWDIGLYNDVMWLIDGVMGFTGESPGCRDLDLKALRGLSKVARREVREFVEGACFLCDAPFAPGGRQAGPGYFGHVCRDCWRKVAKEWRDRGASWRPSSCPSDLPF
jgi:hypothetical protein